MKRSRAQTIAIILSKHKKKSGAFGMRTSKRQPKMTNKTRSCECGSGFMPTIMDIGRNRWACGNCNHKAPSTIAKTPQTQRTESTKFRSVTRLSAALNKIARSPVIAPSKRVNRHAAYWATLPKHVAAHAADAR